MSNSAGAGAVMFVKEYITATGGSPSELDAKVNDLIGKGYVICGNAYYLPEVLCQAMIKFDDKFMSMMDEVFGDL